MNIEIEARFLRINVELMRQKLISVGAKLIQPETKMTRKHYDFPDGRLQARGAWLRIRDEGNKITLSYKHLRDRTITGTEESETEVSNFEQTESILNELGMKATSVQETLRESWIYEDTKIEIDTWPWIEPQIEIEASNEDSVRAVAKVLGLDWKEALHGSVEIAYTDAFDITEDRFYDTKIMKLDDPTPSWLEKLRKK